MERLVKKLKKSSLWSVVAMVTCIVLLSVFSIFYFSSYANPYMLKNMANISYGWKYGTNWDHFQGEMSILHHVDVPAGKTLIISRTLNEDFSNAALMLKSNHQQLRVFLDNDLLFENSNKPRVKNPGMGLHFVTLPDGYMGRLLRIELTSPYSAYSGAPGSVYIGDIPSLETYGLYHRSITHTLLMVCCLAVGAFMVALAFLNQKQDAVWWSDICFGVFSVLWGFYFPSSDYIAYHIFSPQWVSLISIGLYYLYPLPLMLYFYFQFSHYRKMLLPPVILRAVFVVAAFGLQVSGKMDFPEMLDINNPLYVISTMYIIILGFAEMKKGDRFIRFTIPWILLTFLISIQGIISFYTTRIRHDEILYKIAVFTFIIVVWVYNAREFLLARAREQSDLLWQRMKNHLMIQIFENTTKHLEQVGAIHHEMKNHVMVMQLLLNNKEYDKTKEYLMRLSKQQDRIQPAKYCDHYMLNAILNVCLSQLQKADVKVSHQITVAKELNIHDEDLSSLVMNILDNATEALSGMDAGADKWLELKINSKKPYLYILCKNAKDNQIQEIDGEYLSTKPDSDSHGYGLKIVRKIVGKYDGLIEISHNTHTFVIEVAVKEGTE